MQVFLPFRCPDMHPLQGPQGAKEICRELRPGSIPARSVLASESAGFPVATLSGGFGQGNLQLFIPEADIQHFI